MDHITWDEFERVELRVGTIVRAEEFPEARKPAYRLTIDFGEEIGTKHGTKQSSAQIRTLYARESLVGRQVIGVLNFPPKRIGPVISECLITGFYREDGAVVLAVPDATVANGAKLA